MTDGYCLGMPYRQINSENYYHIYNRGAFSLDTFKDKKDYVKFLTKLDEYIEMYGINIIVYCLMPNHFHLLIQEPEQNRSGKHSVIAALMQRLKNSYTKYFCFKYHHSGVVFQGIYNSKVVVYDAYFDHLIEYILNNPVRKGLVLKPEDWPYSGRGKVVIPQ